MEQCNFYQEFRTVSSSSYIVSGIASSFFSNFFSLQFDLAGESRTAEVNTIGLVREAEIDTEGWVYVTLDTLVLVNLLQFRHVIAIERNEVLVLINTRGSDGLCEDG